MKVLWYCNVLLPKAAEAAKIKGEINTAGWIEGFLNQIWSDYKWFFFVGGGGSGPPGLYGRAGVHPRRLPLRRHSLKREGQLTISVSPSISAGFSRYPTRLAARGPRVFLSARGM